MEHFKFEPYRGLFTCTEDGSHVTDFTGSVLDIWKAPGGEVQILFGDICEEAKAAIGIRYQGHSIIITLPAGLDCTQTALDRLAFAMRWSANGGRTVIRLLAEKDELAVRFVKDWDASRGSITDWYTVGELIVSGASVKLIQKLLGTADE